MCTSRTNRFILVAVAMFCGLLLGEKNHSQTKTAMESPSRTFAYVSLDSTQRIAIYRVNGTNGSLDLIKQVPVSGTPGSLAVDPTNSFLYAAIRSTNSISSFRINSANGDLTPIGTVRAVANPVYLKTDRTGKFLLSAYFADSKAAIYRIGADGRVMEGAIQVLETETNAHAIQTDPTNQYLYIPCRTGETIHQYRFSAATGALTPNEPDRMITPTKTGPRHLAFHPKLHVVYFVNEFGNSVTATRMDPATGTLKPFHTLSTLPGDFAARSSAADIQLTPDGRFLYASNRGHESIAAFAVDTNSGELTSIGIYPTEKTPRSFAVDHSGRFLYAAGQGSGMIAAYEIDRNDGTLKQCATYDAGKNPVWILLVQLH